jgi:hypothetical protein
MERDSAVSAKTRHGTFVAIPGMKRRDLLIVLASSPAAWPVASRAQHAIPVIGILSVMSPASAAPFVAAFRQGLSETGYVEGQNVSIQYRWAEGRYDQLLHCPPISSTAKST